MSFCYKAWAPLVRALRFNHPVVARIARTHSKEPAQVLLRYSLQKAGCCLIAREPRGLKCSPRRDQLGLYTDPQVRLPEADQKQYRLVRFRAERGRNGGTAGVERR